MSRKWQIGLKNASDKVGIALGDAQDDQDVDAILTDAKTAATSIDGAITSEVDAFVRDLPNHGMSQKKQAELEAVLRKAADGNKAKLAGVQIFADIAQLKENANKSIKELKKAMSTTVVRAEGNATIDTTRTDLELQVDAIVNDLKVNINKEVEKGKDLLTEEDKLGLDET